MVAVWVGLPARAWGQVPAGDDEQPPVAALEQSWVGVYDDLEQVIFDERGLSPLASDDNRRIRTIVAPVALPWLGKNVLYLEEFPQGDPDDPRREVLLWLAPESPAHPRTVRVRQLTFREPARWSRLYEDTELQKRLSMRDLASMPACDLLLTQEGEQWSGGTVGRGCVESLRRRQYYVDYRLLVGNGLNWYRKRLRRVDDNELIRETVAFDWFELHQARLYACRVRWSPPGRANGERTLAVVGVHDQGGRSRFVTPDGRSFQIELHSGDWPFDSNRDALILILRELGAGAPLVSSWAGLDAREISASFGGVNVTCGPFAPSGGGVS